jgi:2-polyprenyl-3-methyl-5-hydroxy-6-metoxy-1,4-benzoquinol methylase
MMSLFDYLAIAYDNSIYWKARLEREIPFILRSIGDKGNRRVLDMACGSGRHAIELATMGFIVDAFDSSSAMIEVAENLAKDRKVELSLVVDDMLNISKRYQDSYDLILCLGNSLALLSSLQEISQVLSTVFDLLSNNGAFVFQTLNFDEIASSGFSQFESKSGILTTGEEVIFRRRFDHSEGNKDHTVLVLSSSVKRNNEWIENTSLQKVLRVSQPLLENLLKQSGFGHIEVYSNYDGQEFLKESSRSMVFRAKKS